MNDALRKESSHYITKVAVHEPAAHPLWSRSKQKMCNKHTPTALNKSRTSSDFKLTEVLPQTTKAAAIALPEAAPTCKHTVMQSKWAARVDGDGTKDRFLQAM